MTKNLISIDTREATLKRKIRNHLHGLGFIKDTSGKLLLPNLTKETYRNIHGHQREEKLERNRKFLEKNQQRLLKYFANGNEVIPTCIRPRISLVKAGTLEADLFRFATLCWRVPVSEGYGRRMRFLVWDDSNDKLIGLFALGDAVFNLRVRDEYIGWSYQQRAVSLVNLMDAYVLGAVPPYNTLLGGKLVACLIRSKEVVSAFRDKYKDSVGIISGQKRDPHLLAVTTTSALGRSSIYNRLSIGGNKYFTSLGYTAGWGHFHFPDELFDEMKAFLINRDDNYAASFKFGEGPNWRLRTIKRVLSALDLGQDLAQHGLFREVFFSKFATNALDGLQTGITNPNYETLLSASEVSNLALERWIYPRSISRPDFFSWQSNDVLNQIDPKLESKQSSNYALR